VADLLRAITGQMDVHWHGLLWPKLAGLTDDEYNWQPVEGCWTLRPTEDGLVAYDFAWPPPAEPPVTTIAWRLFHISIGCFAERATRYFPDQVARPWTKKIWEGPFEYPSDAAGALALLEQSWTSWRQGLEKAGEAGLWQPLGDAEGDVSYMQLGKEDPFLGLVLHVHREVIHHGAEILLLRDLYRCRDNS
jgi:hypothetical protein